ncbi:MAG: hypothetical protein H0T46_26025 [Deltaproteobacteria bacterium]|nr:hypothetical protein [Deltaproteobacteria bacterium]
MERTARSRAGRWRSLGCLALGAITLALAAPDASAQPVIPFKSREIQPGRKSSQHLLAAPGISESSGQLTYGYPIEIPAGRGVTPTLVLEYSSSAGPSEFGYGWDLTLSTIERTQRNGVTDYIEDLYRYKNGHSIAEVVPTGVTTPGGGVEYRERVERSFNRYLRFGDRWIIQTPNGVRLELGTTRASRRGKAIGRGLAGTAAWLVDRIIDTNNNYAQFEYAADSLRNAQLRWVRYNGNAGTNLLPGMSVELVWESHFGPGEAVPWHRSGYPRVFGDQRLASVVVRVPKHAGNTSVLSPETRTTRFTYASPTLTSDRVFYLESAGIDGFPSVQFEYSRVQPDGPLDEPLILPVFDPSFPNLIGKQVSSSGGETTTITVADATGDAIPDIVGACHPSSGFWTIWANDGRRLVPTRVATPDDLLAPHRMPDPCALRRQGGGDTVQDFFDLDGDGAPDVVYIGGSQIYYCPGRGRSGFGACVPYTGGGPSAPGFGFLRRVDSSIADVFLTTQDLVDFDGDGRVDILRTSSGVLEFFRNIGPQFGFAPAVLSPAPACPYQSSLPCLRASENKVVPGGNRRQLADLRDVNGDGLPDYIASDYQTAAISVAYGTGGANGTGAAFSTSNSMGISVPLGVGTQSGADYRVTTDLVDVNADALPDLVTMNCATSTLTVRYNNGRSWDSAARSYSVSSRPFYRSACLTLQAPDGNTIKTHSSFGDFSGDGIPDFLSVLSFEGLIPTIHLRRTHYAAPRRLVAIRSLSGNNVATVEYRARVPSKQVPVHTVASLTRRRTPLYAGEPARATTQQTHFGYGEPAYDAAERTFMGFGSVGASMTLGSPAAAVDGTFTSTVFHTDLPRQGLVAQRLHTNARASGAFDSILNFYTLVTLGANRTWSRLDRTLQTPDFVQYTGKLMTSYDALGNPLTWTSSGFWNDPADDIQFHRTFRTRLDDQYTVNLPIEEYSVERGARGSRTRYFYDSPVFGATPTKGNLVRVERERDPGSFIARSFFYNSEGNVSRELDELNNLTRYAYDSTYRLYRTAVSDSVGTITRSYHALNGMVAEECGPQFLGAGKGPGTRSDIDLRVDPQVDIATGGRFSDALKNIGPDGLVDVRSLHGPPAPPVITIKPQRGGP